MSDSWIKNEAAAARVRELLTMSGLHHELKADNICRSIARKWNQQLRSELHVTTEPVTYSTATDPRTYREIDQLFQFYVELDIGRFTGVQLIVDCPIECKFRKDVVHFSYASNPTSINFPIVGFVGSQFLTHALQRSDDSLFRVPPSRLTSIVIKDGTTPQGISDESLIHNAAGALYDFIAEIQDKPIIRSSDLLDRQVSKFMNYVKKKRYHWGHALPEWICSRSQADAREYYEWYFSSGKVYEMIRISFPIVCLSGDIWEVSDDSQNAEFTPISSIITTIRKSGWPPRPTWMNYSSSGDVATFVTNPTGLPATLECIRDFVTSFIDALSSAGERLEERWPLERDIYQAVAATNRDQEDDRYQSHLSFIYHP